MLSVEQQQAVARAVLHNVWCMDPYAIVAGGAPRDWYYGKPARDLDIPCFLNPKLSVNALHKQFKFAGLNVGEILFGENIPQDYQLNPDIRCVVNVEGFAMPVQIIVYRTSTFSVVDKFPLSICQAWYDGYTVGTTQLFEKCAARNVIIKTGQEYADGHKYIQKIRDKFPHMHYYKSLEEFALSTI